MRILLLAAVTASCFGCLHTQEVDTGDPTVAEEPKQQAPAPQPKPTKPKSSAEARPPVEEGRPELSVSPQGLMHPEGPRLIQQALTKHGYLPAAHQNGALDKETSAALRKFQGDEQLAKTGAPDRETVRRLGVPLDKVFRSSTHGEPSAELNR